MKPVTLRRTNVSSSKISAILNKNKYRDVIDQYLVDTKQKEPEFTATARQKVDMGTMLEPVISAAIEKHFGIELVVDKTRYHHDDHDYFTVEFDALDYTNEIVYEFKNTEMEESHLIEQYYSQVQFAMYIIGWNKARICYLRNGWDLGYVEVDRDENFIEHMVKAAEYYWTCLNSLTEPDPSVVDAIADNITFYQELEKREGIDVEAELEVEDIELLHEWGKLKKKINELQIEEARLKGHFADKWGKYKDEYISYANAEYTREGGLDIRALQKDHPEIDFDMYRKPATTYTRQVLKYKTPPQEEEVTVTPSIV